MEKVVRNGMVAVLVSRGYGAGWSTWGAPKAAMYHPMLVSLVEQNKQSEITNELCKQLFGESFYTGGAEDLCIKWVEQGTAFRINEYDGSETLEILGDIDFEIA